MASKLTKASKYRAKRTTTADGITHASKKQSIRWVLLRQLERSGEIINLRREVPFKLNVNGVHVCTYRADHVYEKPVASAHNGATGYFSTVVEDVKGMLTATYKLKKRLMKAVHNIDILEV